MDKYSNNLRSPGTDETDSRDKMVKILTVSLAVVLVALIGVTYYFLSRYEKKPEVANTNTPPAQQNQGSDNPQVNQPVQPAPQVTVSKWDAMVTPPVAPVSMEVYKMKQNYTSAEVQGVASKLGANAGMQESESTVIAYSKTGDSILVFNKAAGDYAFSSDAGVPLPAGVSENESVYTMLRNVGMYDDTIKVTGSYMKKSMPGVKYVELHRSWTDVKMPILSSVGVINLPENVKLSQLAVGRATADTPEDLDITGTSDNSDGLKRRDDFNTIIVGIDTATNKVVSIKSNARILLPEKMTVSGIAKEDVMTALQSNNAMIFTSPAGEGATDFSKVYPDNKVMAQSATITDIGLAYIEQAPTVAQTQMMPYYVVRGYMQSDSGYRLNFVGTVPAGQGPQAKMKITIPGILSRIAGAFVGSVYAQVDNPGVNDPGQKQGTLTFPTSAPGLDFNHSCNPSEADMVAGSIHEFNGLRVGFAKRPDRNDFEWYYLNRTGKTPEQIVNDVRLLLTQIKDTVPDTQDAEFREKMEKMLKEIAETPDCPIRFTGSSPSVFAYGSEGTEMKIAVGKTLYAEPAKVEGAWNVTVKNEGLDVNGNDRDYIYYEYDKVDFSRPSKGWVVSRTQLDSLSKEIAAKMEMNAVEAVRLNFELNHALADVKSDRIFVGMIDQAEVNAKLPMNVSPMPEAVARYHFYVGAAKTEVEAPVVMPVDRAASMVLEIGAAGYNN